MLMIILGLDPGIARLGYGVIDADRGGKAAMVAYGCIETSKDTPKEQRFLQIANELGRILAQYKPVAVGVERLYFSKNVKTALTVGEARGVIVLTIAQSGVPMLEVDPGEVKQALTGYGKADKVQMQKMITLLLKLTAIPKPDDAADALAIAYTTALKYRHT